MWNLQGRNAGALGIGNRALSRDRDGAEGGFAGHLDRIRRFAACEYLRGVHAPGELASRN